MTKLFFLGFLFLSISLSAQINFKELKGNWITDNTDSLFFKTDTISFLKSTERLFCNNAVWSIINRSKFSFTYCNCCTEPPRVSWYNFPQKLKLEGAQIEIYVNKIKHDRFRIIGISDIKYYNIQTKILRLVREKL